MNEEVKSIFIINPVAGSGKTIEFLKQINSFKSNLVEVRPTTKSGDALQFTKEFSNKYLNGLIYSVGGDGTLNEVVNGIGEGNKLHIIPMGSGNDFYRATKDIVGTKTIDLGEVNGRKYINIASIGIDATIADLANQYKLEKSNSLTYLKAIKNSIKKYEPYNIYNNGQSENITILTLCNGKYYGNGVPINPNYDLNDGFLNLIKVGELTRLEIIKLFAQIYLNRHTSNSKVTINKIKSIKINAKYPMVCQFDGETIYDTEFSFKVIEDGIQITNDIPLHVKNLVKTIK